jgi:hypothetical protein
MLMNLKRLGSPENPRNIEYSSQIAEAISPLQQVKLRFSPHGDSSTMRELCLAEMAGPSLVGEEETKFEKSTVNK